jgi:hypothetical protein
VLLLKKNSPHIAFGVGIVGVLAGTVLASKATLKVADKFEDLQDEIEDIKDYSPQEDKNKDLARAYIASGIVLAKAYAPAAIVTGLSIVALTGSHIELTKRNKSLTVAYAALHNAYNAYRGRVKDKYGSEEELDIYHAVKVENKGTKQEVKLADPNNFSPYARFFDEASSEWTKDPEMNRLFVTCQQNYLNHILQVRGHVFLNEAYDALGLERSSAGAVVGWVISQDSDNYIDFGIFEAQNARFINGIERSILLDFNVDGVIYDKIGRKK